ncbi:STAS/SEC14 domain-containing protein [Motilimonas pumila]|uniref:STAS/SEC14 domain-containing protein n=1 Tax=Motilimonas pumila TaxID=2303987 RepID=UPI0011C3F144|nr:STAS/SEC14 domain-containing protein [Motilimonas pumila]
MTIVISEIQQQQLTFLHIKVEGWLRARDYVAVGDLLNHWPYRCNQPALAIVDCRGLTGWHWRALYYDLIFSLRYRHCFAGFVVLGNRRWQHWGCGVSAMIMGMPIHYCNSAAKAYRLIHSLASGRD